MAASAAHPLALELLRGLEVPEPETVSSFSLYANSAGVMHLTVTRFVPDRRGVIDTVLARYRVVPDER